MTFERLIAIAILAMSASGLIAALHLHAPAEFRGERRGRRRQFQNSPSEIGVFNAKNLLHFFGLIPADIAALDDRNLTQREDKLLIEAIIKLGDSEGDASRYLEQHDVHLAAETAVALQKIERKLAKMRKEVRRWRRVARPKYLEIGSLLKHANYK